MFIYSWKKHALILSLILFWGRGWHWRHWSIKILGHCTEGLDQLIHFQTLNWYWPVSSGHTWSALMHLQVNYLTRLYHSDIRWPTPSVWAALCHHTEQADPEHVWKSNCITMLVLKFCLDRSLPCLGFTFKITVEYFRSSLTFPLCVLVWSFAVIISLLYFSKVLGTQVGPGGAEIEGRKLSLI